MGCDAEAKIWTQKAACDPTSHPSYSGYAALSTNKAWVATGDCSTPSALVPYTYGQVRRDELAIKCESG
jgi:hypothetical protein